MQEQEGELRILVVDDIEENRALAKATLEDEGYAVTLAASGEEGLRAFQATAPACVILDVRMPGMDGLTLCERIRGLPGGADVPVLFLTALRDVETFDKALVAGGDDFLTKPVRPTELVIRVRAAIRLRQMSAELREQVGVVKTQRDDLLRLQLLKERLMAFVVHDLKNPLSAMDLHAQMLLLEGTLSSEARDSVESIREGVRSLLRLILDLLDISKSEEGQLVTRRAEVDLDALVRGLVETHEVRATAGRLRFHRSVQAKTVQADPDLLQRVLENLLDNAVRHAPAGSKVSISAETRGDAVEIRIADQGRGIPAEQREKVFERFAQIDVTAQSLATGRGLGLTFCRLAVEAHGGAIWVEDGQPGAVFCMRLPNVKG